MDPADHGTQDDGASGRLFAADAAFTLHEQQPQIQETAFTSPWHLSAAYGLSGLHDHAGAPSASNFSIFPADQHYGAQGPDPHLHPAQYGGPTFSQELAGFNFSSFNAPLGPGSVGDLYNSAPIYGHPPTFATHGVDVPDFAAYESATPPGGTISPHALINGSIRQTQDAPVQSRPEDPGPPNNPGPAGARPGPSPGPSRSLATSTSTSTSTSVPAPAPVTNPSPSTVGGVLPRQDLQDPSNEVLVVFGDRPTLVPPSRSALLKCTVDERTTTRRQLAHYMIHWRRKFKHGAIHARARAPPRPKAPQVAKAAVTQRAEGDPSEASSPSSDEESYSDSSYDEAYDTAQMSPLPSAKPTDAVEAMRYDMIKILWRPPHKRLTRDEITSAFTEFSGLIKAAKDRWDAIEKDEASKASSADVVKSRLAHERRLIGACVSAAIEFGHAMILNQLGAHQLFLLLLAKVLRDRIKDEDFTSNLVLDILDLMSRVNPSETILEQLKFSKVAARLSKRGNQRTRELVDKISKTTTPAPKPQPEVKKEVKEENKPLAKPAGLNGTGTKPATKEARSLPIPASKGVKRPGDGDIAKSQPTKKQIPNAGASSNVGAAMASKGQGMPSQTPRLASASKNVGTGPTGSTSVKSKTTHVTAKPTGFFAGLNAASKVKPSVSTTKTTTAPGSSAVKAPAAPTPAAAPAPSAPRPVFSLFDTLDSLNKSKEADRKAETTTKMVHETEDEKRKRLRKEERRKLRVSFKPDDSLVEIRYIEHVHDEEAGRTRNLLRDAGDAMQEGRMFKQHRDVLMGDDEDVDGQAVEELNGPYESPLVVNLDLIDSTERERNFIKTGGSKVPDSPEKNEQDQREATTLMVVYTDIADIPPSPAEPLNSDNDEFTPEVVFGTPPGWITNRDPRFVAERIQANAQPAPPAAAPAASHPDLSALLKALAGPSAQQAQPAAPPKQDTTELEKIFARYSTGGHQAPAAPAAPIAPVAPVAPTVPTQAAVTQTAPMPDIQRLLAAVASQQPQSQTPSYAPQPNAQLQNILAQLGQANVAASQNVGYQPQSQPQPQQARPYYDNYDSNRRNQNRAYDGRPGTDGAMERTSSGGGNSRYPGRDHGGNRRAYDGPKLPCKYFAEGYCRRGDDCTYQH